MEQRMCIRIGLNCCLEGVEDQGVVIVIANHKGNNSPVKQVKNGAEIDLVYDRSLIPLKLRKTPSTTSHLAYLPEILDSACSRQYIEDPKHAVCSHCLRI